jgi:hypothetical protein
MRLRPSGATIATVMEASTGSKDDGGVFRRAKALLHEAYRGIRIVSPAT